MKWILVLLMALVLQQFLPWWSIAIAGFIFGFLIDQSIRQAFFNGFLGIFIYWSGITIYVYFVNDAVLANRLALLTGVPHGFLMTLIPGITGGIIAGLASMCGRYLRIISGWQISD